MAINENPIQGAVYIDCPMFLPTSSASSVKAKIILGVVLAAIAIMGGVFLILAAQGVIPYGINVLTQAGGNVLGASTITLGIMGLIAAFMVLQRISFSEKAPYVPTVTDQNVDNHPAVNPELSENVTQPKEAFFLPSKRKLPPGEYALNWDMFFGCQKEIHQPDPKTISRINLREILGWTSDVQKQKILEKGILTLERDINITILPNWLLRISGFKSPEETKRAFSVEFEETRLYLRGVIDLVNHESSLENQQGLKAVIAEDFCAIFKECSPTWHRQSQHYYLLLWMRKQILSRNHGQETLTDLSALAELKIKLILQYAVAEYKEEVVLEGRQLETDSKKPIWHYLSYFVKRVGGRVGITPSRDSAMESHENNFDKEGQSDAALVEWFQGLCCADHLIDYILSKIHTEQIEYKNDEGEHLFLTYIQKHLSEDQELERYYTPDFRPNRLGVAFLLEKTNMISKRPTADLQGEHDPLLQGKSGVHP